MLKFNFSVQTRDGQKVDGIQIAGKDREDAQRKLVQMYRNCTVLHCEARYSEDKPSQMSAPPPRLVPNKPAPQRLAQVTSVEDILTLIAKQA